VSTKWGLDHGEAVFYFLWKATSCGLHVIALPVECFAKAGSGRLRPNLFDSGIFVESLNK